MRDTIDTQASLQHLPMSKNNPAILRKVSVSLPFGIGSAEWETDETERKAAWCLYVELVTRVAVQPLEANEGLLREALNSLYALFSTTREILKEAGPGVGGSRSSVGGIAIATLNLGLRPFLAKWHPELQDWESHRPQSISLKEHEKSWPNAVEFRASLKDLRKSLESYSNSLAKIAGVEQ
jgi:hypothetical protein